MILGVGLDLCQIFRIERSLKRLGDDWIDEVFTADERSYASGALTLPCYSPAVSVVKKRASKRWVRGGPPTSIGTTSRSCKPVLQPPCGCRVGLFRSCKDLRPPATSLSCMSLAPVGAGIAQAIVTIAAVAQ
jgi:holo-[acyl-carrier protein] synthase